MYSQLKSCVKVKNSLSHFFECCIGTRQGCLSSPIIFALFINDLIAYLRAESDRGIFISNDIEDLIALMFADDVACFSDTIVRLQRLINLIEKFCKSVGMKLNLGLCYKRKKQRLNLLSNHIISHKYYMLQTKLYLELKFSSMLDIYLRHCFKIVFEIFHVMGRWPLFSNKLLIYIYISNQ